MSDKKKLQGDAPVKEKGAVKEKKKITIPDGMHKAVPIILLAMALFTAFSFIAGEVGTFGSFLSEFLMGMFARGAYAVPVLLAIHALFYLSDVSEKRVLTRVIFSLLALVALSSMIYGIGNKGTEAEFLGFGYYKEGVAGVGGGLIGGFIGYALNALFGYVGVIIISVAMFAIYVTYFFSKGSKTLKKAAYVTFKVIVSICAFIERTVKKIIRDRKEAKNKRISRKLDKKSRELSDDDFFDVDNGIESLKISELGISETRSRETLESRPTLHDKVHHKSEFFDDEPTVVKDKNGYFEADFRESPRKNKKVNGDYAEDLGFSVDEPDIFAMGEKSSKDSFSSSSDASADAVFTKSFDPFSLAHSEKLANKPSSKSTEANRSTFTENISELTEEDVARARRNAAFERRKAEIIENARREAAKKEAEERAAAVASESASHTVPSSNEDNESAESVDYRNYSPLASEARGYSYTPAPETENVAFKSEAKTEEVTYKPQESSAPETARSATDEAPKRTYPSFEFSTHTYKEEDDSEYETEETYPASAPVMTEERAKPTFEFQPESYREEPKHFYENSADSSVYTDTESEPNASYTDSYTHTEGSAPYGNEIDSAVSEQTVNTAMTENESTASTDPLAFATPAFWEELERVEKEDKNSEEEENEVEPEEKSEYEYNGIDFSTPTLTRETVSGYYTSGETEEEPKAFEPKEFTFDDEEEKTEVKPGLIFEVEGEFKEPPKEEEPKTIAVERTMLGRDESASEEINTEAADDNEDEILTDGIMPEDKSDDAEQEEIPPEKQNPKIMEYRDMFKMYRDEKADEESETDEPVFDPEDAVDTFTDEPEEEIEEPLPFERDIPVQRRSPEPTPQKAIPQQKSEPARTEENNAQKKPDYSNYQFPPLELLALDEVQDDDEISKEIEQNTNTLIETLASFNVTASIKGVDRGPRVTRYEVVPARGVKVNAITNLFDNIALNLAAEGIRMEAPIPGKSAIGFEIPNKRSSNVRLRELLECEEFVNAKSKTFVCIGKDVGGNPVFGDIAKFPHALVAGATGMGKSVCINSIMISLLYKARPDEVKFIMIDPKKVEFRMYSGIPHLLIPVITEAKQAAGALMWAVEEMERRYGIIEQLNIRNIETYNEKCAENKSFGEPMPKIVIVIDELNDLMMQVRDPVEDLIMRIAQKARAAGIHLIIGTQRPDVKVVTGTIKANINTRISCKVTSVVDSRTILEMAGAEKLLNRGDMLFKPVDKTKPIRVQGCFVSDPEVEAIMDFLKSEAEGNVYDDEIFAEINRAAQKCGNKKSQSSFDDDGDDGDGDVGYYGDQQFLDAVELAIRSGKVSTSLLQRKLSIGYGKAAKFIDAMEDIGIVSEQNGQKPRDILLSMDEWHEKLSRVNFDD